MPKADLQGKQQAHKQAPARPKAAETEKAQPAPAEPTAVLMQRAVLAPGTVDPADGRRLQRSLGNRGLATLAGARSAPLVQRKLTVGPANDTYEQEADRMAARVIDGGQQASAQPQGDGQIRRMPAVAQRQAEDGAGGFGVGADFESGLARASGGGSPLPAELRQRVEPAYGANFDNVRVHSSKESAGLADSIQAKAFTHGSDIHFNAGEYDPNSSVGQRLIAHELTHVVQQGAAVQKMPLQRAPAEEAKVAVQRSPQGVIQREGKRVNSLIAFWESQKRANAPQRPPVGGAGGVAQQPAVVEPQADLGGDVALLADAVAQSGQASASASGSGTHFATPNLGGTGGGVLVTPNVVTHISTGSSFSSSYESSSDWSSSLSQASAPFQQPLGMQFPGQTKYKDRLSVDAEYSRESHDSTNFLLTKVFQQSSEAAFFANFDENQRKVRLNAIGWTDQDIADLEATRKSKVKYITAEDERADYRLNLGPVITQGAVVDPFDTSGMFAMGVGAGHAIFVMDPNGAFYAGRHKVAAFHHSSFLGGGKVASAGTMKITQGKLVSITAKSGHYIPGPRQLRLALAELRASGVSLSNVSAQAINPNTFRLDPEEDAQNFLNQGITPDAGVMTPMSSSPVSATASSSWQSSSQTSGSFGGFAGGFVGRSGSGSGSGSGGGAFSPPQIEDNEKVEFEAAGGPDWEQKLQRWNVEKQGSINWSCNGFWCSFFDIKQLLDGSKKPEDLEF